MFFSVIVTTFNRVDTLPRAVESVLEQRGCKLELIVVNDGSTDGTAAYLAGVTDERIRAIHRDNGGLGAARNTGIAKARGDWTTFLDDDDRAMPGWLSGFADLVDSRTGIVCCSAQFCDAAGVRIGSAHPGPLGGIFRHQKGLMLAGTFAVDTRLLRLSGGYDERLTCSHQTELAMRLIPIAIDRGLRVRSSDRPLVRIERRGSGDRPMSSPASLYYGTQVLLDKHGGIFAQNRRTRAAYRGVLGVSAARLERWSVARSALLASARDEPLSARRWMRFGAACVPPIARHVWSIADYSERFPNDQLA